MLVSSACGTVYETVVSGAEFYGPDPVPIRLAFLGGGSLSLVVAEVVHGCVTEMSRGVFVTEFAMSV